MSLYLIRHGETAWSISGQHTGRAARFHVHVDLGELDPVGVRVELYAEGPDGGTPVRQPLGRREHLAGSTTHYVYAGEVPASRPSSDFTPRLMPFHAGASVPLEAPFILWYTRPQ